MTRVGLTEPQQRLYAFVAGELQAGRPAPNYTEMARHIGCASRSNVHRVLTGIIERGWLVRLPRRSRAIGLPLTDSPERRPASAEAPEVTLRFAMPGVLARQLSEHCLRQQRSPEAVMRDALAAHLRGRP